MRVDECWLVLMRFDEIWWELMSVDECWWDLMRVDECWWVLISVDESWWELMSVDECWWDLMRVDECWWVLMSVDECWCELVRVDGYQPWTTIRYVFLLFQVNGKGHVKVDPPRCRHCAHIQCFLHQTFGSSWPTTPRAYGKYCDQIRDSAYCIAVYMQWKLHWDTLGSTEGTSDIHFLYHG